MKYKVVRFGNEKTIGRLEQIKNITYDTFEEAQAAVDKYFRYEVRLFKSRNRDFCKGLDKSDLRKAAERSGKINLYQVYSA